MIETTPTRNFARTVLPWLVAAAMLLLYLRTLDKVVTVTSVFPLARATGLDWRPTFTAPLSWLVTLPVGWLPSGSQLLALNFIGAFCAALSLALLARCVSLLPHDRTQLQRDKLTNENSFLNIKLAWVPVLFAVLVCGLQRTFWENAIVGTGEALDLLLFAYCVRCLLEYRVEENNRWLYKLALVYGLGITNNFAMIAFFPALLVALLWIKGLRFFRFDFLSRMFLFGLAGLSLYLLLPLVRSSSDVFPVTFWQALKGNLAFQKQYILHYPRWRAGWIGIYALLPLLLAGVRWPGSFGDIGPVGSAFSNVFGQVLHAGLLGFCLYMAFDPPAGPREFGLGLAFLPCYFLAALSIGYYSGFLLLVFDESSGRSRRQSAVPPAVNYAVTAIVCAGAIFVAARLMFENYPKMREFTSRSLYDYARALRNSLPDKSAVLLSDDPVRLYAVGAVLGRAAVDQHLLLDTGSLDNPKYHQFMRKRYGDRWPKLTLEKERTAFSPQQVIQCLSELGQKNDLTYLHPSFGDYFETFYLEPRHLVYSLKTYPPNTTEAPAPGAAIIEEQAATWNAFETGVLKNLKAAMAALPEGARRAGHGPAYVAVCYSRALDWWGVELQRAGQFEKAFKFFDEAVALNPDNASALINRDANALWRKGGERLRALNKEEEEKLKLYRGMDGLLNACGPVDVPEFQTEFVTIFVQGGLFRQAAQMMHRALAYAPNDIAFQTTLANVELMAQQPDRALALLSSVKPRAATADPALQIEIARIEAFAQYTKSNFSGAKKILEDTVGRFPAQDANYNALVQLYVAYAGTLSAEGNATAANTQLTNALAVTERQIRAQPQNASAYFSHGALLMFVKDFDRAITQFSKVLELQKDNSAALLNRAMANFQSKKIEAAKRDYQELLSRFKPNDFRIYYGLGEIAYQQKNWRAAKDYYQQYLRYAPPDAAEAKSIRARLEEVKKKS